MELQLRNPPRPAATARDAGVGQRVTLAETWQAFLRSSVHELRPATLASYRGCMRKHVLPALGHLRLGELTRERIRAFVDAELAAGASPRTVRNSVGVIRSTLRGLVRSGVLESNPASIARGRLPPRPRRPKVLTRSELRRFLEAAAGDPYEDLILFLALTGVRLGEALALRWSEVDLGARTAIIRRSVRLRRRNLPTIRFGFRTIDLTRPLVAALARRREEAGDADRVFETDRRSARSTARHLHGGCRRVAERAGLAPVHPHTLRHTWAAIQLEAGIPIDYVSRSLGHASSALTAAAYCSARPKRAPARRARPAAPRRVMMSGARP
jgi:integrase